MRRVRKNSRKNLLENKKDWYKIGKRILQKFPVKLHLESKTGTRWTYQLYNFTKGDWKGPTTRAFSKMNRTKFENLCAERILNKGLWQDPLLKGTLLDPTIVDPLLQKGLVSTSSLRPRDDDILEESPIADSWSSITDSQ